MSEYARGNVRPFRSPSASSSTHTRASSSSSSPPSSSLLRSDRPGEPAPLDAFSPDFDVVYELTVDRDRWRGDSQITLYVPDFLRVCLDRVRAKVAAESEHSHVLDAATGPSLFATIACCTYGGMGTLTQSSDIAELLSLKRTMHLSEDIDAEDAVNWAQFFRRFSVSLPDNSGSGISKQNVYLPESVKAAVCSLAADLGVPASTIVTLTTMMTLANQPTTLLAHREVIEHAVRIFHLRIDRRKKMAQILLGAI